MTLEDFQDTLVADAPPQGVPRLVQALWWDACGDWARAHRVAQDDDSRDGAWVHAYLHRKEGDLANAGYWYRCAGRTMPTGSLDVEWAAIAEALLVSGSGGHTTPGHPERT